MLVKLGRLISLYFVIIIVIHEKCKKNIIEILHFIILKLNVHKIKLM